MTICRRLSVLLHNKSSVLLTSDCGSLTQPENGYVDQSNGTTYGQTAVYSCNMGYELFGSEQVICLDNGLWSMGPPVCRITGVQVFI